MTACATSRVGLAGSLVGSFIVGSSVSSGTVPISDDMACYANWYVVYFVLPLVQVPFLPVPQSPALPLPST